MPSIGTRMQRRGKFHHASKPQSELHKKAVERRKKRKRGGKK